MGNDEQGTPVTGEVVTNEVVVQQTPATPATRDILQGSVDTLLESRAYFIDKVLPILKENQDFYEIKNKKSLAKGGAEKLATIFGFVADFIIDQEAIALLKVPGLMAFICNLKDKESNAKGQGRGADTLARNQNDANKTLKMAQKRAFVDAVIRATGLSDIFTQDLEDLYPPGKPIPAKPPAPTQSHRIDPDSPEPPPRPINTTPAPQTPVKNDLNAKPAPLTPAGKAMAEARDKAIADQRANGTAQGKLECTACGAIIGQDVYNYSMQWWKKSLCRACQKATPKK